MSIVVSLAPLFGWKDENWSNRVTQGECMVSTRCGVIGLSSIKTVRLYCCCMGSINTDCAKLIESRIKKCRRFYYLKYMEAEDS